MLVDLYVGFATDGRAEEKALAAQIRAIPGAEQVHGIGTQLVHVGLVLVVQLAVLRRISAATLCCVLASLALFVAYEALDGAGRQALMPFAVLFMWPALAPLGWRLLRPGVAPVTR